MSGIEDRQDYVCVASDPWLLSDRPKRSQDTFLSKTHIFVCKVSFASGGVSVACEHAERKLHTWESSDVPADPIKDPMQMLSKKSARKPTPSLPFHLCFFGAYFIAVLFP